MKDPHQITPAEFEILDILWQSDQEMTVGDILPLLRQKRAVAYTTVMTLLGKLARKGSVKRSKAGKAYRYRPHVLRHQVLRRLLNDFAQSYCGGDRRELRALLAEKKRPPGSRVSSSPQTPPPAQAPDMDVVLL